MKLGTWPWRLQPALHKVGLTRWLGWHLNFVGDLTAIRWAWLMKFVVGVRFFGLLL